MRCIGTWKAIVISCALLFAASPAKAVDLKNEDSRSYIVGIHERSFTTWTSVSGGTTLYNICPECRVEVVGLGKVYASGEDIVVIKDGALDIQ